MEKYFYLYFIKLLKNGLILFCDLVKNRALRRSLCFKMAQCLLKGCGRFYLQLIDSNLQILS